MADVRPEGAMAALGAEVPPPVVQWNGKAWQIGHPTQGAKALLERLVLQSIEANLEASRGVLSEKRFAAEDAKVSAIVQARAWATFGAAWLAALNGPMSFPLFLCSLVQQHHPEFTPEAAQAMWLAQNRECRTALVQVLPDFFPILLADLPADDDTRKTAGAEFAAGMMSILLAQTPTG